MAQLLLFTVVLSAGAASPASAAAYEPAEFKQTRITDTWEKYRDVLTWGKGQCLAILDDGCNLADPAWKAVLPWGPKVIAGFDSIDMDADPTPVPPGYHGTSVGYPSSYNYGGKRGVAYNDSVAHIRAITIVHLRKDESQTLARGLQWVIENHQQYRITAVNLSPVDDQAHARPVPTAIDAKLAELRQLGIWVSAPCGNNHYTKGISWPACQPDCFAIGGAKPSQDEVYLDRQAKTALVVSAAATSSSNAIACGAAIVLCEAIAKSGYAWRQDAKTLPEAMMAIFQRTGVPIHDPATGLTFRRLDLLAAVDHVFAKAQ